MQDRIGSGSPGERFAALVVSGDEVIDLVDQVFHAGEGAAANRLVGDQSEEALDLVEPGTVGWDEVDMPARPLGQPSFDSRVLVRAVIVYDEMDIQPCRDVAFDPAQESQELLCRWRGLQSVSTVPWSTSKAANSVVVPWRL